MQPFDKATRDYIADRFCDYFDRKKPVKITPKQANMLIDFANGPSPGSFKSTTVDFTKPCITGGGRRRPSQSEIDAIFPEAPETSPWDAVFDETLCRCADDDKSKTIIECAFNNRLSEIEICTRLHIERSNYYDTRGAILMTAGILAVQSGVLKY